MAVDAGLAVALAPSALGNLISRPARANDLVATERKTKALPASSSTLRRANQPADRGSPRPSALARANSNSTLAPVLSVALGIGLSIRAPVRPSPSLGQLEGADLPQLQRTHTGARVPPS